MIFTLLKPNLGMCKKKKCISIGLFIDKYLDVKHSHVVKASFLSKLEYRAVIDYPVFERKRWQGNSQ